MTAELTAALNAFAAVLAGFNAEVGAAPPALRQWLMALISTLEDLLAVLGDEEDEDEAAEAAVDTRRVGAIRDLLARFDREAGDPQHMLEAIGRVIEGGQP